MRHDGADICAEVLSGRDLMEGFRGFLSTRNDAHVSETGAYFLYDCVNLPLSINL